MTKAEQARLVAWRSRILQHAAEATGTWRAPAGISASLGRPSTNGSGGSARTARPACATGPGPAPVAARHAARMSSARSSICASTYHFGPGKIADYLKRFHQVSVARVVRASHPGQARDEPAAGQSEASPARAALAAL